MLLCVATFVLSCVHEAKKEEKEGGRKATSCEDGPRNVVTVKAMLNDGSR